MSLPPSKLAIGVLVLVLAVGGVGLQVSMAGAAEERDAAEQAAQVDRRMAAARWDAAVVSAREAAARVVEPARSAAADLGDLAPAVDVARLGRALLALDRALATKDIGAIAARRDDVNAELARLTEAAAMSADGALAANPSASESTRAAVSAALASLRSRDDGEPIARASLTGLRTAIDELIASHAANVAAAAAAAAAAEAANAGEMSGEDSGATSGSSFTPGLNTLPRRPIGSPTPPAVTLLGDYRPGCETQWEWDWWYEDSPGHVTVNPSYAYDIAFMPGSEGYYLSGVRSVRCASPISPPAPY